MTDSKFSELPKKYPLLFKGEVFYSQCGDGWVPLLDTLLNLFQHKLNRFREVTEIKQRILAKGETPLPWIAEYFEKNPEDPLLHFNICQIKEKFGGLRFYWDCDCPSEGEISNDIRELRGATQLAESMSYKICEVCGLPGATKAPGGWYKTLCENHHLERIKENTS